MGKKIVIFLIWAVIVAFAVWLLLSRQTVTIQKPSATMVSESQSKILQHTNENRQIDTNLIAVQNTNDVYILGLSALDFYKRLKIDRELEWKMPINFYGRVVDESDDPVANANVHFEWNDTSTKGTSDADAKSDGNGFFSLTNHRGKRLYIDVSKDGYYSSGDARNATFEYAQPEMRFTPDPDKPVIFHLRKKGETEPMIHGRKLFGFKTNGTPYYVNLLTGKKFTEKPAEWDLAISFICSPPNAEQKFDWIAKIETSGGGLIETNSDFMFPAPEGGYNNVELGEQASDPIWRSDIIYKFFFKSREKIYGQFTTDVYPKYTTNAAIDLNYYVNPSGSRNLEFDSVKEIKGGN